MKLRALMNNVPVSLDHQNGGQYGEPTFFVIKRVNNQTSDEGNIRRFGSWTPVGTFEHYYRGEFTILLLLILSCLIIFIVLGNILVVAAVFHERSLHRCSNYLIVSLAFADLMVGIMVMPISAVDGVSARWFLGHVTTFFDYSEDSTKHIRLKEFSEATKLGRHLKLSHEVAK
nr:hypothetical transcript [Hymenolepis microstoma]